MYQYKVPEYAKGVQVQKSFAKVANVQTNSPREQKKKSWKPLLLVLTFKRIPPENRRKKAGNPANVQTNPPENRRKKAGNPCVLPRVPGTRVPGYPGTRYPGTRYRQRELPLKPHWQAGRHNFPTL
eukprot:2400993-Rhodomonas_salina.1